MVDSQLRFRFFVILFLNFFHFSGSSVLRFALWGVGSRGGQGAYGACLGHMSLVAAPEAPVLRLLLPFPSTCLLQTVFSKNPIHVPCFISHVTFLSTVTLLFIITCRRGSSLSLSRTLTHYAYPLISDALYATLTCCGRPFPGLSCI